MTRLQKNTIPIFLLSSFLLIFLVFYFIRKQKKQPIRFLPYYGQKIFSNKQDTVYHTIPNFEFIDQSGNKVTQETVKNKIYVTDYFFTTCHTICPIMSNQMERVANTFKGNADIMFLSHTVNPEDDSVSVLNEYAIKHHANKSQWLFLTGNKKALYSLARKGYLLNAEEGDGGEDDFIHTQNFALIDKEKHIRGFYDGTDSTEVNRLIIDIQLLLDEYSWKKQVAN